MIMIVKELEALAEVSYLMKQALDSDRLDKLEEYIMDLRLMVKFSVEDGNSGVKYDAGIQKRVLNILETGPIKESEEG